jgi:hypothetical protein
MATETNKPQKPVKEIRFGAIKCAIWKREHEGKIFYSTSISRSYRVDEQERDPGDDGWREVNSFDFVDLDTVKTALEMAHKWIKGEILAAV